MDVKERIDALAGLMDEFRLDEASLKTGETTISFRRRRAVAAAPAEGEAEPVYYEIPAAPAPAAEAKPAGIPVSSPMNGIFYGSPSPSAPAFVKEGDTVAAGQVIGLIEAMKVFNEIPSPVSGTVLKIAAENGQVVQPGDALLFIG